MLLVMKVIVFVQNVNKNNIEEKDVNYLKEQLIKILELNLVLIVII